MDKLSTNLIYKNVEITVLTKGAELSSYKVDGEEFIWERDPQYWGSSSPILFPFVGVLKDEKYEYKGKNYEIKTRHGFARDNNFDLVEKGENFLKYKFSSNEETLKKYPFEFELFLTYIIKDSKLELEYEVVNKNDEDMYFSIGAHPAFALTINNDIKLEDYYLEFSENEIASIYKLNGALVSENKVEYLHENDKINLTNNIFDEDAIIFKNLKSKKVTIKCKKSTKTLELDYNNFPYIAFWSKPKAPFVCIEPWFGISDFENCSGKLEEKIGIEKIEKNNKFIAKISISGKV